MAEISYQSGIENPWVCSQGKVWDWAPQLLRSLQGSSGTQPAASHAAEGSGHRCRCSAPSGTAADAEERAADNCRHNQWWRGCATLPRPPIFFPCKRMKECVGLHKFPTGTERIRQRGPCSRLESVLLPTPITMEEGA